MQQIKKFILRKKKVILVCFVIFSLLTIPFLKAKAGFFDDAINHITSSLEGVEEMTGPISLYYIIFFFTYIFNLVYVYASSYILQYTIDNRQWLSIRNSSLVQSGYHFTAGLANLFLILVFVIIAISYILKLETFQAKKSLARLIIVALLMNFSLVFIGALVDIFNVLYNTILTAGGTDFIINLVTKLTGGGFIVAALLVAAILGLIVSFALPYAGLFAQVAFGIFMVTAGLPTLITWIFQIIVFMMMGGIFLIYAFLFAARVFVIQILAALAPLAFVCLILPQTKKYWDDWLKHLLSWLSLGVIVLLFLVIGSKITGELVQPSLVAVIPIVNLFNPGAIVSTFVFYFFVFIYLTVVLFMSSKTMPEFATFLIKQAQSAFDQGQKLMTPLLKATYKQTRELAQSPGGVEDRLRRSMEQSRLVSPWVGGPGRMDALQAERLAKEKKPIERVPDTPEGNRALLEQLRDPRTSPRKVAALAEVLGKRNELDLTGLQPAQVQRIMANAQAYRANMNEITASRPDLAPLVTPLPPTPYAPAQAHPGITDEDWAIMQRINRIKANKARDIHHSAFDNETVVRSLTRDQIQDLTRAGSTRQKQAIVNTIRNITGYAGQFPHMATGLPPVNGISAEVIDYIGDQQQRGTWPL